MNLTRASKFAAKASERKRWNEQRHMKLKGAGWSPQPDHASLAVLGY